MPPGQQHAHAERESLGTASKLEAKKKKKKTQPELPSVAA
jgi:hypothetical protein